LTEASSSLATVSEKKMLREDAKFLIDFVSQVNTELNRKKDEANKSAENAVGEAKSKQKAQ
jgi:hypothetical protein